MKVYVDKLPENCGKCCFGDAFCCINGNYILDLVCSNRKHKDCPLQSLSDYTKQVRKEVVQEIRNRLIKYTLTNDDFMFDTYYKVVDVEKVLDQIGETNGSKN